MVEKFNEILQRKDYSNEEDMRSLVYICANNPDFDLPFICLLNYPVLANYAEYWEKGRVVERQNAAVLGQIYRSAEKMEELTFGSPKFSYKEKLKLQSQHISQYLKKATIIFN